MIIKNINKVIVLAGLIVLPMMLYMCKENDYSGFILKNSSDDVVNIDTILNIDTALLETIDMVFVEGGMFRMGATEEQVEDAMEDEYPVQSITLSDFYIGKYEVTQELWEAVMGNNPSRFYGANRPVECVSWIECQEFIERVNKVTGKTYRLPTEAEWEYAARGGNRSNVYKYSGSNDISEVAWFGENSLLETHVVGKKKANELGIYDMSGNVYEWCSDWYGNYSSGEQTDPQGPATGSYRVYRGGSWGNFAKYCRVSDRSSFPPDYKDDILGFRLVLVP